MKKIVALLLVMIAAMTLVACGGSSKDLKKGKYAIVEITDGKDSYKKGDEMFAFFQSMTLEIKDGDKFSLSFGEESSEGTYKVDGSKIEFTVDGETQEGSFSGKKITLKDEDTKMIFELQ